MRRQISNYFFNSLLGVRSARGSEGIPNCGRCWRALKLAAAARPRPPAAAARSWNCGEMWP